MNWINRSYLYGISFGFFLSLQACQPVKDMQYTSVQQIQTGPGPEDIALYTGDKSTYLFLSCDDRWNKNNVKRNGIYKLNISSEDSIATPIPRKKEPNRFKRLHPHGIDVIQTPDGRTYVYVIHHAKRKAEIVKYEYKKRKLFFVAAYAHPWMSSPNDIAVRKEGGFFVTNDQKKRRNTLGFLFGFRGGRILFCDEKGHWSQVGEPLKFPNGIALSEFENYLYVSTTRGNQVFQYLVKKDGNLLERNKIARIKGADNITISSDGIYVTSHSKLMKFVKHFRKKEPSPSLVYKIDRATFKRSEVFYDDGQRISAASTAIYHNGVLYISPIFQDFILKVKQSR